MHGVSTPLEQKVALLVGRCRDAGSGAAMKHMTSIEDMHVPNTGWVEAAE